MSSDRGDKTTAKHMAITFIPFVVPGVFLIIGANIAG